MFKILLPIISLITGSGLGVTAAIITDFKFFESTDAVVDSSKGENKNGDSNGTDGGDSNKSDTLEIVKLPNQFVIPVVSSERVHAMVIISVALEVPAEVSDTVRGMEPKLRDAFLSVLFDIASLNGFDHDVVTRDTMDLVKDKLTDEARHLLKLDEAWVLITEITRQTL